MPALIPIDEKAALWKVALMERRTDLAQTIPAAAQAYGLDPDRMVALFVQVMLDSPDLFGCSPASLYGCLLETARLGLEPGGVLGQAYYLPFACEATFCVGYKGFTTLALRSPEIAAVEDRAVFAGDVFEYEATSDGLHFRHAPRGGGDGAALIAAWARLVTKTGQYLPPEVVWRSDIDRIKASARGVQKPDSPWRRWEAMMWRKTAIRRGARNWPCSPLFRRAAEMDALAEAGKPQPVLAPITVPPALLEEPKPLPGAGKPDIPGVRPKPASKDDPPASDAQIGKLHQLCRDMSITDEDRLDFLRYRYGIDSSKNLTIRQASKLIDAFEASKASNDLERFYRVVDEGRKLDQEKAAAAAATPAEPPAPAEPPPF